MREVYFLGNRSKRMHALERNYPESFVKTGLLDNAHTERGFSIINHYTIAEK